MSRRSVISGATVVLPTGRAAVDVSIQDGLIAEIGMRGTLAADEVVDAAGLVLLPGVVDIHVHFRQPGFEEKEDFGTGSAAAACGGVTTVCDMPNTHPPVIDGERFAAKRALVEPLSYVDFGLWAGGTAPGGLAAMVAHGAVGLKVYLNRSHRSDDPYAADLSMPDEATLRATFAEAARLGVPVAVHVADHGQEAAARARLRAMSRTDARLVCRSYRDAGVLDALRTVLDAAAETHARVHVAHASLAPVEALDLIGEARRAGSRVSCECGPPALLEDDLDRLGVRGVPFAFPRDEAEAYWAALADGRIDLVATDHAPHSVEDKLLGRDDVWAAPPGYPAVETSLPLLVDAVHQGRLTWERLAALTSSEPARLCGLTAKGVIAVGRDADLVLVDPGADTVLRADALHSKAGWTPFEGRALTGAVVATYLRGRLVARDGQLTDVEPRGRFLVPYHPERRIAP